MFIVRNLFLSAEHTIYAAHLSYYNGVSDLHRHRVVDEQLDRTYTKDAGIDLVLEKARGADCWACYRGCLCVTL
jgi:hypothetical protein